MIADAKWVERNLGYHPDKNPLPLSTFADSAAARPKVPEDLQREIIDFDSEGGLTVLGESFQSTKLVGYAFIWLAFGVASVDTWRAPHPGPADQTNATLGRAFVRPPGRRGRNS